MFTAHRLLLPPPRPRPSPKFKVVSRPSSKLYHGPTLTERGCSVTNTGSGCPRLKTWFLISVPPDPSVGPPQRPLPEPVTCKWELACSPGRHPLVGFCSTCHLIVGSAVTAQIVLGDEEPLAGILALMRNVGLSQQALEVQGQPCFIWGFYGSSLFIRCCLMRILRRESPD